MTSRRGAHPLLRNIILTRAIECKIFPHPATEKNHIICMQYNPPPSSTFSFQLHDERARNIHHSSKTRCTTEKCKGSAKKIPCKSITDRFCWHHRCTSLPLVHNAQSLHGASHFQATPKLCRCAVTTSHPSSRAIPLTVTSHVLNKPLCLRNQNRARNQPKLQNQAQAMHHGRHS